MMPNTEVTDKAAADTAALAGAPIAANAANAIGGPAQRLALVELQDSQGRLLRTADVWAWPLHIGRGLDQDLVLDDPFVAPHHASLWPGANGQLQLQVGQTVNGVAVQGRVHAAGSQVPLGLGSESTHTLQLGQTRLLLRLAQTSLAPERRLPGRSRISTPVLWSCGLAVVLLGLLQQWLGLDPGADATAWLPGLLGPPAGVLGWCAMWALVSKLFQGRFDFVPHLRIALPWLLATELTSLLLPQLAAVLGWPWLWRLAAPLQVVMMAAVVRQHLVYVLPQQSRRVTSAVVSALVVGSALSLTFVHRDTDRLSRAAYMSTLPLPALHAAPTGAAATTAGVVQDLAPLAQQLQRRVTQARIDDAKAGDDGTD
jgi:hypothetical protein